MKLIGTCKSCKTTLSVDAHVNRREEQTRTFPIVYRRVVVDTGRLAGTMSSWIRTGKLYLVVPCACGARMQLDTVAGTKTDHVCNAKCTASKGHVCECSCGGANHGASFAA